MPARRKARSLTGKPAGSIRCASMPKQAASRRMVPVFWGMSGSNRAIGMMVGREAREAAFQRSAATAGCPSSPWSKPLETASLPGLRSGGKGDVVFRLSP